MAVPEPGSKTQQWVAAAAAMLGHSVEVNHGTYVKPTAFWGFRILAARDAAVQRCRLAAASRAGSPSTTAGSSRYARMVRESLPAWAPSR